MMPAGLAIRGIAYAGLAIVGFAAGWLTNGWRIGENIATEQTQTVVIVRKEEIRQQSVADKESQVGHEEFQQAQNDLAIASNTAIRMRDEARKLATKLASCNAGTSGERSAREDAGREFAKVFAEMEQEGRYMAGKAEQAWIAGSVCERTYDGVKGKL